MLKTKPQYSSVRYKCPNCGARRGVVKILSSPFAYYCFACGFKNNNSTYTKSVVQDEKLLSYYHQTMKHSSENYLAVFLQSRLTQAILKHLQLCHIGTDSQMNTVFWYKNADLIFTHAKIIHYNSMNGKRLKNNSSPIMPFGTKLDCFMGICTSLNGNAPTYQTFSKSKGFDTSTLFNEHLLYDNAEFYSVIHDRNYRYDKNTPVLIVESEKTALIASFVYPQFIWIASGGANRIPENKLGLLRNRNLQILFDNDKGGMQGSMMLKDKLSNATLLPMTALAPNETEGYDIGDLILDIVNDPNDLYDLLERFCIITEHK